MFSDAEPSVDDTIFQDLRLVDGSVGRTKIRGSYPIVTSDVPGALSLGFRQRLTSADVDRLLSALNHCCRYYAESIMLPVTITGSGDGSIGTGAGGAADSGKAGSPVDQQVLPQESFWNPVGHDDWVKLIDGLSSYHRRGEACWLFAHTVGNLPYHSPMMGVSKAGQDTIIAVDARLIRLGALRLAIGSFAASIATTACVELIALLVEMQGDQKCCRRDGQRIHKLFEATSARLWQLAGPPLHRSGEEGGPDLSSLPPFWAEASVTWLQEIVHARRAGFLPGDELILSAQKLFLDLPPPSGGDFPAAMNRRRGGTGGNGHHDQDQDQDRDGNKQESESKADGQSQGEVGDAPTGEANSKDRSGTIPGAADENSSTGEVAHPAAGKSGYDASVLDPSDLVGLGREAAASFTGAIDKLAATKGARNPELDRLNGSFLPRDKYRLRPTMRPMDFLDLAPHNDEGKRQYAEAFSVLTTSMPLTALPGYQELGEGLSRLRAAMPNFGSVLDMLQGDFAFAQRSGRPTSLRLRPMLLVGPPAIGKTRFARELAKTLGAEFSYISVAGDADNRRFAGTAHGYTTAHPSWPVERMVKLASPNPILIVDEIEKAGGSKSNGTLADTILCMLEAESAKQFSDPFLGGPIDLSMISWIFLANSKEGLSEPLLSRLEIFRVEPLAPEAFDSIVQAIIADIAQSRKVEPSQMPALPELFLAELKTAYVRRRDLRRVRVILEKAFGILARYDNEHPGETLH